MSRARVRLIALGLLLVGVAAPYLYYVMPFEPVDRPTLVGRERLSCGDIMLTQTFTGGLAPGAYVVLLYFRSPEAKHWDEYYLDHESLYWRGSIDVAADRTSSAFHSYGTLRGSFSCSDREMLRPRGNRLGPKAIVADPLSPRHRRLHNSPMDVGASSNQFSPG